LNNIDVDINNLEYSSLNGVLFDKNRTTLCTYPIGKLETSYSVPDGVKCIGDHAFFSCDHLKNVSISDTVTSIGYQAFTWSNNLEKIDFSDSIEFIGADAFKGCSKLESVTIPKNLKSINASVFAECEKLSNINIASGNLIFKPVNGVLFNEDVTILHLYPFYRKDKVYTVPEGVTTIDSNAFSGCKNLEEIILPSTLININNEAFESCVNLNKINIPNNVRYIGSAPFYGCTSLEEINVAEENTAYKSIDGVLYNNNISNLHAYPSSKKDIIYKIPQSIKFIKEGVFCGMSNSALSSVIFPDNNLAQFVDTWRCEYISKSIIFYCLTNSHIYNHCKKYDLKVLSLVDVPIPVSESFK